MLFEIHKEGKIAYKRLSDADLKRGGSHQTHIGLSVNSLTFMADDKTEYSAMIIYKEYCDILDCEIAKIHRANGNYDAPKISKGRNRDKNIVNSIREFVKESENKKFYLLWFGLDSMTPVFFLIEEDSYDYNRLNNYCDFAHLKDKKITVLERDNIIFPNILQYIQSRMENVAINLQKALELSVETEIDNPKFKDSDVRKARKYIQELGKQGEALVDEYLMRKKFEKKILNYEWFNKSGERGKPFDFRIEYFDRPEQWVDVKTTEHEFEQAVIVSKNEIKFITEKMDSQYAIYRVYFFEEFQAKLKICSKCLKYVEKMYRDIDYMTKSMKDYNAAMINYKIAFEPNENSFNDISSEISLSRNMGVSF